jgi:hypothetical protein
MKRYLKLLAALGGAVAVWVASAITDGHIDTGEKIQLGVQITTVAGVWMVAEFPGFTYGKTLIAAVLLLLNGILSDLTGGVSTAEWVNLAIAFFTALGVFVAPQPLTAVRDRTQVPTPPRR